MKSDLATAYHSDMRGLVPTWLHFVAERPFSTVAVYPCYYRFRHHKSARYALRNGDTGFVYVQTQVNVVKLLPDLLVILALCLRCFLNPKNIAHALMVGQVKS